MPISEEIIEAARTLANQADHCLMGYGLSLSSQGVDISEAMGNLRDASAAMSAALSQSNPSPLPVDERHERALNAAVEAVALNSFDTDDAEAAIRAYLEAMGTAGTVAQEPEDDAPLTISYAVHEISHNLLTAHTGQEGGCPRINWYKLRAEISDAIAVALDKQRRLDTQPVEVTQEPVAWGWKGPRGVFIADDKKPSWPSTPLYAAPQPAAQEPVAVPTFSATASYVAEFGVPGWAKEDTPQPFSSGVSDLAKSVLSDVLHDQKGGSDLDGLEKHIAFAIQAGIERGVELAASTLEAHPGREWFTDNDGAAQWRLSSRADFAKAIRSALSPLREPAPQVVEELCRLTFAVQHNPNCPSPWLVRLAGKGPIDMKPYGDPLGLVLHQTGDILGFGKTFEDAARAALASSQEKKG